MTPWVNGWQVYTVGAECEAVGELQPKYLRADTFSVTALLNDMFAFALK